MPIQQGDILELLDLDRALFEASSQGNCPEVHRLLDANANINSQHTDKSDGISGKTPLFVAAERGHADVVALLLNRKADPTIRHSGHWSPYEIALIKKHQQPSEVYGEILKVLKCQTSFIEKDRVSLIQTNNTAIEADHPTVIDAAIETYVCGFNGNRMANQCTVGLLNPTHFGVWMTECTQQPKDYPKFIELYNMQQNSYVGTLDLSTLQDGESIVRIGQLDQRAFFIVTSFQVMTFDSDTRKVQKTIKGSYKGGFNPTCIALLKDKLILDTTDGDTHVIDLSDGKVELVKTDAQMQRIIKIDDDTFATQHYPSKICIWDLNTRALKKTCKADSQIYGITASNDGKLASYGADDTLIIWDVKTGQRIRTLSGAVRGKQIQADSVTFLDKNTIAAGHADTIKIWDIETGKLLSSFKENNFDGYIRRLTSTHHPDILISAACAHHDAIENPTEYWNGATTAGHVPSIKVWNCKTSRLLHEGFGVIYHTVFPETPGSVVYATQKDIRRLTLPCIQPTLLNKEALGTLSLQTITIPQEGLIEANDPVEVHTIRLLRQQYMGTVRFFNMAFDQASNTTREIISHTLTPFAILFIAAALLFKKSIMEDNNKIASVTLGFIGYMLLLSNILCLFREARSQSNAVHERVITILDTTNELLQATTTSANIMGYAAAVTTKEFVRSLRLLTDTTEQVVVQLKDETRKAIIELTGEAHQIALSIERGIQQNRFKPEAHVVATTHVNAVAHVKTDVNTTAQIKVPVNASSIVPKFIQNAWKALRF